MASQSRLKHAATQRPESEPEVSARVRGRGLSPSCNMRGASVGYMRLSFVVPAYNEEAYLPACLESILAQTRELGDTVEIIVVNNASTDRTREVALGYPGVRVVDEPRKGLTFARQAGFAASTGELIANVDSDSRLTPGWVRSGADDVCRASPRWLRSADRSSTTI